MGSAFLGGPRESVNQQSQLALATNEVSVQTRYSARLDRNFGQCPHGAVHVQRLDFALGGNRVASLVLDHVAGELVGQRAHDHLAGLRALLQSGRHVHGVAADHELAVLGDRGDGLAGVDTDSYRDLSGAVPDLEPSSHRALGVVVVNAGHAEDDHRGVACELLDGPAIGSRDLADALEVARHHRPDHLGIALRGQLGRADDIGEQDRHDLAPLAHGAILP